MIELPCQAIHHVKGSKVAQPTDVDYDVDYVSGWSSAVACFGGTMIAGAWLLMGGAAARKLKVGLFLQGGRWWRGRIHLCLGRHLEGLYAKLVPRKMRATSDDSKADGVSPYSRPTPLRAWSATTASTDVYAVDATVCSLFEEDRNAPVLIDLRAID